MKTWQTYSPRISIDQRLNDMLRSIMVVASLMEFSFMTHYMNSGRNVGVAQLFYSVGWNRKK